MWEIRKPIQVKKKKLANYMTPVKNPTHKHTQKIRSSTINRRIERFIFVSILKWTQRKQDLGCSDILRIFFEKLNLYIRL